MNGKTYIRNARYFIFTLKYVDVHNFCFSDIKWNKCYVIKDILYMHIN